MGFWREFKEFAIRGNILGIAVGILIGSAFGKIISSFVADILLPPITLFFGKTDITHLAIILREGTPESPPVVINYGKFLQTIIDFIIIVLALFLVVKLVNSLKRREEQVVPSPSKEELLLQEIRDLLKEHLNKQS